MTDDGISAMFRPGIIGHSQRMERMIMKLMTLNRTEFEDGVPEGNATANGGHGQRDTTS